MHGLEISAVFDLSGKTALSAMDLRNTLVQKLREPDASYNFSLGGVRIYPILGDLVKADFYRHGSSSDNWSIFKGLCIKVVEVKESGTDHFPTAGFYHAKTMPKNNISGASATVSWKLGHAYPLSEDMIEAAIRNTQSGFRETIRLEIPVVYSRSWTLTLTAPTFRKALAAHKLLRSGVWQPATLFADALPDQQKLRLLQQTIEEED